MLLCVDSVHVTGWHVFCILLASCFFFVENLSQTQQNAWRSESVLFKPDGRILGGFVINNANN